eukprot:7857160-Karenia_brevis.AAC.2
MAMRIMTVMVIIIIITIPCASSSASHPQHHRYHGDEMRSLSSQAPAHSSRCQRAKCGWARSVVQRHATGMVGLAHPRVPAIA